MAKTQIKLNQAEMNFMSEDEHVNIGNNAPHHPREHSLHDPSTHTNIEDTTPFNNALIVYNLAQNMWKYSNPIPGINRIVNTKTITTTSYLVTDEDYLLVCDNTAAGGDVTVVLPTVSKIDFYIVKSKTAHKVIINGNGATINGAASLEIQNRYDSLHIVGDTEWYVI